MATVRHTLMFVAMVSAAIGMAADRQPVFSERAVSFQIDGPANSLLMQAAAFAGEDKPELVFSLLEQALGEAPGELATTDGEQFLPVRQMAMQILRQMPPEALASYRVIADASVRTRLAEYERTLRLEPLEDCYVRFFLGSLGDQAAFIWACHLLDAGDYARARRVLLAIRLEHPDPDVPLAELLPRLALAHLRCQDVRGARETWRDYERTVGQVPAVWQPLGLAMSQAEATRQATSTDGTAMGDDQRSGWRATTVVPATGTSMWAPTWTVELPYEFAMPVNHNVIQSPGFLSDSAATKLARQQKIQPTTQVVMLDGLAWVISSDSVLAIDPESGTVRHRVDHQIVTQNDPHIANLARNLVIQRMQQSAASPAEEWLFQLRAARAMSVVDDKLYYLESHAQSTISGQMVMHLQMRAQAGHNQPIPPLGNRLTAVNAATGKIAWSVGRDPHTQEVVALDDTQVHDIPYLAGIKIDGEVADWRGRGMEITMPGRDPASDLSGTTYLGWTEDGLLIHTEVVDDVIQEAESINLLFQGDSVEYFAAPRRGSPIMYQMIASTGIDPAQPRGRHFLLDHRKVRPNNANQELVVHVAHGRGKNGSYIVEVMLPWANIGLEAEPGKEAAFQHYINDVEGKRPHWVCSWFPRTGTHRNSAFMHRIRLVGMMEEALETADVAELPPVQEWHVNSVRFLATPVLCSGVLVVPAEDQDGMSIYGLDPATGVPVWHTRLGSSLPNIEIPSTEMHLTVDGTTAYFCTGQGIVAAIDAADGQMKWGRIYASDIEDMLPELEELEASEDMIVDGQEPPPPTPQAVDPPWRENVVLVEGDAVLVFARDADRIQAYDRLTGQSRWLAARPDGAEYVVGRAHGLVILGGRQTMAAIDPATGALAWRREWPFVSGTPAFASDMLLVPCDRTIEQLDPRTGETVSTLGLKMPDRQPIGNLYPTGDGILVANGGRIFRIDRMDDRIAKLNARIEADPTAADLVRRARYHAVIAKLPQAKADYEAALALSNAPAERSEIVAELMTLYLDAADRQPAAAAEHLQAALALPLAPADHVRVNFRYACALLAAGDRATATTHLVAVLDAAGTGVVRLDQEREIVPAIYVIGLLRGGDAAAFSAEQRGQLADAVQRWAERDATTRSYRSMVAGTGDASGVAPLLADAERLRAAKHVGVANAVLQRNLAFASAEARRSIAAALVDSYIANRHIRGIVQLRHHMAAVDTEWVPRDTAGAPVDLAALSRAWLSRPSRLGWSKKQPLHYVLQVGIPNGILAINHNQQLVSLDWRTGDVAWTGGRLRNFNQNAMRNVDLMISASTNGAPELLDLWTGSTWEVEAVAGETSPMAVNSAGLVTCYSVAKNGTISVVDAATNMTLWTSSDLFSRLGTVMNAQVFMGDDSVVIIGWGQRRQAQTVFNVWTGEVMAEGKVDPLRLQMGLLNGGQGVTVEFSDKGVQGLDVLTDEVVWRIDTVYNVARQQPLQNGNLAVLTRDRKTLYLETTTGKILYESAEKGIAWNQLICDPMFESVLFIANGNPRSVVALDGVSGRVLYEGALPRDFQPIACLADGSIVAQGNVQITDGKKKTRYTAISIVDPETHESVMTIPSEEEVLAMPANQRAFQPQLSAYGIILNNRSNQTVSFYPFGDEPEKEAP